jgi:hypothetical protein
MKRILQVGLLLISCMTLTNDASAQGQGVFLKQVPKVVTGGHFNSSTIAGGSASYSTVTQKDYTVFPLYTKLDTVSNTGADTVTQKITGYNNSVYTWVHVNSISGTNTSCTVSLQVTGDVCSTNCYTADWETVQTFTVSATGNPYKVLVNSGNGWPYTNLRWIFTGVGTHSSSWYGGLLPK